MAEKRRLNLSFSMASPFQREAWERLCAIPAGQRTDTVCRAVCRMYEQDSLLEAVRQMIQEELRSVEFISAKEESEQPQAEDVRTLKSLKGATPCEIKILSMRRRSIALCPDCFAKQHNFK